MPLLLRHPVTARLLGRGGRGYGRTRNGRRVVGLVTAKLLVVGADGGAVGGRGPGSQADYGD